MGSGLWLALSLGGVCLSGMLAPILGAAHFHRFSSFRSLTDKTSPYPHDGDFFKKYMKCDVSSEYCFEYDKSSWVGPRNWAQVAFRNRLADVGPDSGNRRNTRCCDGLFNSPIKIKPQDAKQNCQDLDDIEYSGGINGKVVGSLENSGVYPNFKAEISEDPLLLKNAPFTYLVEGSPDYVFSSLHIHTRGSEHQIEGQNFEAEIQLVHFRKDFLTDGRLNTQYASQTSLGIGVVAIFVSKTGENNEEFNELFSSENLKRIVKSERTCPFDKICRFNRLFCRFRRCRSSGRSGRSRNRSGETQKPCEAGGSAETEETCSQYGNGKPCGEAVADISLNRARLLPTNKEYYHYFGSLTSPPCSEVVNWIVLKNPIKITEDQLKLIGNMETTRKGVTIEKFGNIRPLQKLNGRTVLTNIGCPP